MTKGTKRYNLKLYLYKIHSSCSFDSKNKSYQISILNDFIQKDIMSNDKMKNYVSKYFMEQLSNYCIYFYNNLVFNYAV